MLGTSSEFANAQKMQWCRTI